MSTKPKFVCPHCEHEVYEDHKCSKFATFETPPDGFVAGTPPKFHPTVTAEQIEPEKVSDRAEALADGRRPNIFNHRHVRRPVNEY